MLNKQQKKKVRLNLYTRQGGRCHYCNKSINFANMTIDHRTPKSKGGTDDPDNLCLACLSCNELKSSQNHYEFTREILKHAERVLKGAAVMEYVRAKA